MDTRPDGAHATIQADFVRSREIDGFARLRDRRLALASRAHLERGWIATPYAVTAWDEFQTILAAPAPVPAVVAGLGWIVHPARLRIGIGLGALDRLPGPGEPVNVGAAGSSLERAREALESLRGPRKYPYRTAFRAGGGALEDAVGLALRLRDAALDRATDRQREAMRATWRLGSQERVAERLGVDPSTVSRTIARGGWWEIRDAERTVEALLAAWAAGKEGSG